MLGIREWQYEIWQVLQWYENVEIMEFYVERINQADNCMNHY